MQAVQRKEDAANQKTNHAANARAVDAGKFNVLQIGDAAGSFRFDQESSRAHAPHRRSQPGKFQRSGKSRHCFGLTGLIRHFFVSQS